MKDYRDRIGAHAQFDDAKYWSFTRNTGLPRHTFRREVHPDVYVVAAAVVCLIIALIVTNIAQ